MCCIIATLPGTVAFISHNWYAKKMARMSLIYGHI